ANDVLQQHITLQPLINPDGSPIYPEPLATLPNCVIGNQSVPPATWVNGSINDNIDCLSSINKTHLDAAYNDTVSFLSFTVLLTGALCLIFCIALVFTTWRMAAITHRVINIGLSLAVIISVILSFSVVGLFSDMSGRHGSFGQMVKDDYDSIYYAALLKRYGTNANADESRWLIAMEFGDQASASRWQADWQTNTQQVHTLMANAKANRTWPEEDQPLADMQSNWDQYFAIDGQIRAKANDLTNPKHISDAEALSTGLSNLTFDKFSGAVDGLAQANQGHYDSTYASTQGALALYVILSAVLFPLLGLSAVWGVSRRLKDF
ncbi:MAG: tetratricopeptide repeat protein, partial [Chloroflexi bacterium]|nr:tetratricopeptide repeat protein [Chloroflexota bacterium]